MMARWPVGVGEVGYCVPLFGHQLHSALIHARQTSHIMGTGDLTLVPVITASSTVVKW